MSAQAVEVDHPGGRIRRGDQDAPTIPRLAPPDVAVVRQLVADAGVAAHVTGWTTWTWKVGQCGAGVYVMPYASTPDVRAVLLEVFLEAGYQVEEHGGTISVILDREDW